MTTQRDCQLEFGADDKYDGAPGMFLCGQTGYFVKERCEECATCIRINGGSCPECEAACPPWEPDSSSVY